jgi:hypothetical protein
MMLGSIPVFSPYPEKNREPTEGEQNRKGTKAEGRISNPSGGNQQIFAHEHALR